MLGIARRHRALDCGRQRGLLKSGTGPRFTARIMPCSSHSTGGSEGSMEQSLAACVVETAADAIIHACPHGRVRTWNRGACEIFHLPASEAVGRDLTELVTPPHIHHIKPLDPKLQYGRRHLRRAPAMRRDGSTFTAEFTVQPLSDEAGCAGSDGMVVVLRDASEMGETVRKLRERVAELEAGMQRLVNLARPGAR